MNFGNGNGLTALTSNSNISMLSCLISTLRESVYLIFAEVYNYNLNNTNRNPIDGLKNFQNNLRNLINNNLDVHMKNLLQKITSDIKKQYQSINIIRLPQEIVWQRVLEEMKSKNNGHLFKQVDFPIIFDNWLMKVLQHVALKFLDNPSLFDKYHHPSMQMVNITKSKECIDQGMIESFSLCIDWSKIYDLQHGQMTFQGSVSNVSNNHGNMSQRPSNLNHNLNSNYNHNISMSGSNNSNTQSNFLSMMNNSNGSNGSNNLNSQAGPNMNFNQNRNQFQEKQQNRQTPQNSQLFGRPEFKVPAPIPMFIDPQSQSQSQFQNRNPPQSMPPSQLQSQSQSQSKYQPIGQQPGYEQINDNSNSNGNVNGVNNISALNHQLEERFLQRHRQLELEYKAKEEEKIKFFTLMEQKMNQMEERYKSLERENKQLQLNHSNQSNQSNRYQEPHPSEFDSEVDYSNLQHPQSKPQDKRRSHAAEDFEQNLPMSSRSHNLDNQSNNSNMNSNSNSNSNTNNNRLDSLLNNTVNNMNQNMNTNGNNNNSSTSNLNSTSTSTSNRSSNHAGNGNGNGSSNMNSVSQETPVANIPKTSNVSAIANQNFNFNTHFTASSAVPRSGNNIIPNPIPTLSTLSNNNNNNNGNNSTSNNGNNGGRTSMIVNGGQPSSNLISPTVLASLGTANSSSNNNNNHHQNFMNNGVNNFDRHPDENDEENNGMEIGFGLNPSNSNLNPNPVLHNNTQTKPTSFGRESQQRDFEHNQDHDEEERDQDPELRAAKGNLKLNSTQTPF